MVLDTPSLLVNEMEAEVMDSEMVVGRRTIFMQLEVVIDSSGGVVVHPMESGETKINVYQNFKNKALLT